MRGATHELTSKVVFTVAYNPNAASKGGMERGCARAGRVQGRGGCKGGEGPRQQCGRGVRPQVTPQRAAAKFRLLYITTRGNCSREGGCGGAVKQGVCVCVYVTYVCVYVCMYIRMYA